MEVTSEWVLEWADPAQAWVEWEGAQARVACQAFQAGSEWEEVPSLEEEEKLLKTPGNVLLD